MFVQIFLFLILRLPFLKRFLSRHLNPSTWKLVKFHFSLLYFHERTLFILRLPFYIWFQNVHIYSHQFIHRNVYLPLFFFHKYMFKCLLHHVDCQKNVTQLAMTSRIFFQINGHSIIFGKLFMGWKCHSWRVKYDSIRFDNLVRK